MEIGRRIGKYFAGRWLDGTAEAREAESHGPISGPLGEGRTAVAVLERGSELDAALGEERMGEMDEERLQILRMVEERKITAEEAAKLLAALDTQPAGSTEPRTTTRARWLRVRVTDSTTGRAKVNVNVPVSAVLALGRLGNRFGGSFLEKEGIDLEGLIEAIRSGAEGKIVDVSDENSRDHVEVVIE